MNKINKVAKLKKLLTFISESKKSDFYKKKFLNSGYIYNDFNDFEDLHKIPLLTWEEISAYPFLKRNYLSESMFIKVVHKGDESYLIGRTITDIKNEEYGIPCERPLALFKYCYEGIEKGLWFYEHNILPMINEDNLEITSMMASKYKIDGIVAEMDILKSFTTILKKRYDLNHITHIRIIDTYFDMPFMKKNFPNTNVQYTLGAPEVGGVASLCPDSDDVFHEHKNTFAENIKGELVVTKSFKMPTPLMRYKTGIPIKVTEHLCKCRALESFLLI